MPGLSCATLPQEMTEAVKKQLKEKKRDGFSRIPYFLLLLGCSPMIIYSYTITSLALNSLSATTRELQETMLLPSIQTVNMFF